MCSGGGDGGCCAVSGGEGVAPGPEGCRKCRSADAKVTLRLRDRYCVPCFVAGLEHKFKANFGRERSFRSAPGSGTRVLLAHAGDLNGAVLLRLVGDAKSDRFELTPVLAHIDEGHFRRDSASRRRTVEACGFPVAIVPLSEALPGREGAELRQIVDAFRDSTAKRDFLKVLRRRLLSRVARDRGCERVLRADAASDLAADVLIDVALGGGAHVRCDVGFADDRDDVDVLRPMRDFTSEELIAYADVKRIDGPASAPSTDRFADLQSRIESFVSELQRDFPATVPTVLGTGGKLETESSDDRNLGCVFCLSVLEKPSGESSAVGAVEHSERVSRSRSEESEERSLGEFFCYRCRLAGVSSMPPSTLSAARAKRSRRIVGDK